MHDRNGNKLMGLWHPTGYSASDNHFLIGNWNRKKKSLSKLCLKLETSFSSAVLLEKSWVWHRPPKAGVTTIGLLMQDAWWQEFLTSHLRDTVGCLPWDDVIYAVPPLAPSSSSQMPLSALPSLSQLCCFHVCCLCTGASSVAQSGKMKSPGLNWSRRTSTVTSQNVMKLENVVIRTCV